MYKEGAQVSSISAPYSTSEQIYTFENVPYTDTEGNVYEYVVKETPINRFNTEVGTVNKEYLEVNGIFESLTPFTNTFEIEETSINFTKVWNEGELLEKPDITINLISSVKGEVIDSTHTGVFENGVYMPGEVVEPIVLVNGELEGTFENIPKTDSEGNEIVYTVTEDKLDNYDTVINGYTITNTNNEKVEVKVTKEWEGNTGSSVTVNLLRDEKATGVSIVITKDDNWTKSFTGLQKYNKDGSEAVYSIEEVKVAGYTIKIEGDQIEGYVITNTYIQPPKPQPQPKNPCPDCVVYAVPNTATDNNIMLFVVLTLLAGVGLYLVNKKRK